MKDIIRNLPLIIGVLIGCIIYHCVGRNFYHNSIESTRHIVLHPITKVFYDVPETQISYLDKSKEEHTLYVFGYAKVFDVPVGNCEWFEFDCNDLFRWNKKLHLHEKEIKSCDVN